MLKKLKRAKIIIAILVVFLFIIFLLSREYFFDQGEAVYGVTFSAKQARDLGLDEKELFAAMTGELGARHLRLAVYWDEVEPRPGEFDWSGIDWQLEFAENKGADVILAVGGRLPRWPECHFPAWAERLPPVKRQARTLDYIEQAVKRYRDYPNIIAWQVENEPFLPNFGECPPPDGDFLDQEIALVKSLDSRPLMVTDSGELSVWVPAAKRADIFGTTMYRDTYSRVLDSYVHYPIEPGFFRFKRNLTRLFAKPEKWIVVELQAEPWGPRPFQHLSPMERAKTMDAEKFREIIEFSRQAGFREFYLWGVEWWYWECEVNGSCEMWKEARRLFGAGT